MKDLADAVDDVVNPSPPSSLLLFTVCTNVLYILYKYREVDEMGWESELRNP
jgi:hypothetical protein